MKNSVIRLLNPKNLQREVHVYGYHFSWKNQFVIFLCAFAGMAALGIIFKLSFPFTVLILAVMTMLLPVLILNMYRHMYEQKKFADVVTYIEQMMYSFQKSGKVKLALMECGEAFGDGEMKSVIEKAVAYINKGKAGSGDGILKEALMMIEAPYRCRRMHTAHELLLNAEEDGGEVLNSISLILEDTENWKRRVYKMQAEKKQGHMDNIISILIATALCALCLYVIDYMRILFRSDSAIYVFKHFAVQLTSEVFILFSMFIFAKSAGSLTGDWLKEEQFIKKNRILQMYNGVKNYDHKKEFIKSILFALPFFLSAVTFFFLSKKGLCMLFLFGAVFLLFQHKIGYKLSKQDVTNEIYIALPQWLMDMALLLQNNNVQVSIIKSADHAPAVLQPELAALTDRIRKEPDKLSAYTGFCGDFYIPEALSCMKMLHSISESGIGDAKTQIHNLLGHINKLQNQADNKINEQALFKMRMIFSYPVFAAAVKMLVDMTVGMFVLFQLMGSAGGIV